MQNHQFRFLKVRVAAAGSTFVAAAFRPSVAALAGAVFFGTAAFLVPGFVTIVVPALVVLPSLALPSDSCAVPGRFVWRLGALVIFVTTAWTPVIGRVAGAFSDKPPAGLIGD